MQLAGADSREFLPKFLIGTQHEKSFEFSENRKFGQKTIFFSGDRIEAWIWEGTQFQSWGKKAFHYSLSILNGFFIGKLKTTTRVCDVTRFLCLPST